ncbi:MAG: hypothetical protein RLZZ505_1766 [Verrucomicrobiota bacterium]|jgi:hypothetical protein
MKPFLLLIAFATICHAVPAEGLLLDLNAAKGLTLEDGEKVSVWENQAPTAKAKLFVKQDEGRKEKGSGRPTLRPAIPELNGKPALVFRRQELVCMDEDTFDGLTTGKGHTWLAVISVFPQQDGLKDVNSFFGNLRNGAKYEGVWGCVNDDNTLWYGVRNGLTFGRFDENNPQLLGPVLEKGKFHLIGGRMAAGKGKVKLELFAGSPNPVATAEVPVAANSNPSKMAIGQERNAIEHPGHESFDGEIARFLIWERPLTDGELTAAMQSLERQLLK